MNSTQTVSDMPKLDGGVEYVGTLNSRLLGVSARISTVLDRLRGVLPEQSSEAVGDSPEPAGSLYTLNNRLNYAHGYATTLEDQISELERLV